MYVRETHLDADKGYLLGEPMVCDDPFTDDAGELFRFAQSEYGRCVSRVYLDTESGVKSCGWVFQKRRQYEDADESYIHEVWVELLDEYKREVVVTEQPHYLS